MYIVETYKIVCITQILSKGLYTRNKVFKVAIIKVVL